MIIFEIGDILYHTSPLANSVGLIVKLTKRSTYKPETWRYDIKWVSQTRTTILGCTYYDILNWLEKWPANYRLIKKIQCQ